MKKILLSLIFLGTFSYVKAGQDEGDYPKVSISSSSTLSLTDTYISFGAPGTRKQNCITDISGSNSSATAWSVFILDGLTGTTNYAMTLASGQTLVEDWYKQNPLCMSQGVTTYFHVAGASFRLNVSGYVK